MNNRALHIHMEKQLAEIKSANLVFRADYKSVFAKNVKNTMFHNFFLLYLMHVRICSTVHLMKTMKVFFLSLKNISGNFKDEFEGNGGYDISKFHICETFLVG